MFRSYTVTLGATATRAISTVLPITYLRVENENGNADVYIGGSDVSATVYAASVKDDPTAGPPNAVEFGPFDTPGRISLHEFYFLGTEDEVIHLSVITA
jgi:hypothetical protein